MADPKAPPSLEQMLKSGVIKKGSDESFQLKRLPMGIASLDALLGGGLPLGRCVQFYGPESTGKTLLSQVAAAAVQKSTHPSVLYMDMEKSFDKAWWDQSGVDTKELMVSTPTTAEEAIDIMRSTALDPALGLIIVDSIAAMIPQLEIDPKRGAEDNNQQPGSQAKAITRMYHYMVPLLEDRIIFLTSNQMRESIGVNDVMGALPGGHANRHYNHIILNTRRSEWIKDTGANAGKRLGFIMEITQRKNKVASTPDGESVNLPFMFSSQIDYTTSYIEDGIKAGLILRAGPYYKIAGRSLLGIQALREFFAEYPDEFAELKTGIGV